MKCPKEFDCVQMKQDIQQKLLAEYSGMDSETARLSQRQQIASDPVLGPFLLKVADSSPVTVQIPK
jgi:hypothetical protein